MWPSFIMPYKRLQGSNRRVYMADDKIFEWEFNVS